MKRIFISTNETQPANCLKKDDEVKAIRVYMNIKEFGPSKERMVSTNVYLIHDSLNALTQVRINIDEDFLLYHKGTKDGIKNLFSKKLVGHHTQLNENFYQPVFNILLDDNNNSKFEDILKLLGFTDETMQKKENFKSKHNLLHKCLLPETLKYITDFDLEKLTDEEKADFDTFKSNVGQITDPFDGKYVQLLTSLRTYFQSQK